MVCSRVDAIRGRDVRRAAARCRYRNRINASADDRDIVGLPWSHVRSQQNWEQKLVHFDSLHHPHSLPSTSVVVGDSSRGHTYCIEDTVLPDDISDLSSDDGSAAAPLNLPFSLVGDSMLLSPLAEQTDSLAGWRYQAHYMGPPQETCPHYSAIVWREERVRSHVYWG